MFSLRVQNEYAQVIDLTSMTEYSVTDIDGLSPVDAQINEVNTAGFDGSVFNSAKTIPRVITITLAINQPAEENRLKLYTYFKTKKKHRIYYSNGTRNVYIDGYLQSMPIGFFDEKQMVQLVFRCPDPYFGDYEDIDTDISNNFKLFEFPFDIRTPVQFSEIKIYRNKVIWNKGDIETGFKIVIKTKGITCNNIKLVNVTTGEYIGINTTLSPNEELVIDTIDKEKSIIKRDIYGVETNYINYLIPNSTWLKIWPGENVFYLLCEEGSEKSLDRKKKKKTLYEGV